MMKYCESCLTKAFNQHSPRSSIRINKMLKRLYELLIKNLCMNKMMTNSKKIKELANKSKNHKTKLLTWFRQFALTYIHEGPRTPLKQAIFLSISHTGISRINSFNEPRNISRNARVYHVN